MVMAVGDGYVPDPVYGPLLEADAAERMRASLEEQLDAILDDPGRYDNNTLRIGAEVEYPAVTRNYAPVTGETRDAIIDGVDGADVEYAAATVESRTPAIDGGDLDALYTAIVDRERAVVDAADDEDVVLLRYGTNPAADLDAVERTESPKYRLLGDFIDAHRHDAVPGRLGREATIDPRTVDASGVITSTQLNVQAASLADAVEKANYGYMVAPYAVAMTGNARIVEGKDLGHPELRMPIWERSCDIRTPAQVQANEPPRAGKLDGYFEDLEDYFRMFDPYFVADDPESALAQATGEVWKDVKIKIDREQDAAIVEIRPVSTQPSAEADVAAHGFLLGRVAYAQEQDEELLDIEKANRNRYTAMFTGMDTVLYDPDGVQRPARAVLSEELETARDGLDALGLDDSYLDVLEGRVDGGDVPANVSAARYRDALTRDSVEAALQMSIPTAGTGSR